MLYTLLSGHPLHSRGEREGGSVNRSPGKRVRDGLENGGDPRAARALCGECQPEREEPARVVPGVRNLAAYGLRVAAAVSSGRPCRSGGEKPAAAAQPAADARGG